MNFSILTQDKVENFVLSDRERVSHTSAIRQVNFIEKSFLKEADNFPSRKLSLSKTKKEFFTQKHSGQAAAEAIISVANQRSWKMIHKDISEIVSLQQLLNNTPLVVWAVDKEGAFTLSAGKGLEQLGLAPNQNKGQNIFEIYKNYPALHSHVRRALEGEQFSAEVFAGRWFSSTYYPAKNEQGEIIGMTAISMDVTENKQFEARLDEFLTIASHELKTPLTALGMKVQIQKKLLAKDAPMAIDRNYLEQSFDQMERLSQRLSRLVDDMLDITRIRTGRLQLTPVKFDLLDLIKELSVKMRLQFLEATGESALLEGETTLGEWDHGRIQQVFSILLTNAIKYGKGNPVSITVKKLSNHAIVSVKDRGIGITLEDQNKIFQKFQRAVDFNEVSGFGLGLFIANQIVKVHGGKMWVESKVGVGSEFFVELPL